MANGCDGVDCRSWNSRTFLLRRCGTDVECCSDRERKGRNGAKPIAATRLFGRRERIGTKRKMKKKKQVPCDFCFLSYLTTSPCTFETGFQCPNFEDAEFGAVSTMDLPDLPAASPTPPTAFTSRTNFCNRRRDRSAAAAGLCFDSQNYCETAR